MPIITSWATTSNSPVWLYWIYQKKQYLGGSSWNRHTPKSCISMGFSLTKTIHVGVPPWLWKPVNSNKWSQKISKQYVYIYIIKKKTQFVENLHFILIHWLSRWTSKTRRRRVVAMRHFFGERRHLGSVALGVGSLRSHGRWNWFREYQGAKVPQTFSMYFGNMVGFCCKVLYHVSFELWLFEPRFDG